MSLDPRRTKASLLTSGSVLVVFGVVVNLLDMLTTFIGWNRGLPEQNPLALPILGLVDNKYVGALILKALLFLVMGIVYRVMQDIAHSDAWQARGVVALLCFDLLFLWIALHFTDTVLGNLSMLGWLGA